MKTTERSPSWKLAVAKMTTISSRTGGNLTRREREAILTRASFNAESTKTPSAASPCASSGSAAAVAGPPPVTSGRD